MGKPPIYSPRTAAEKAEQADRLAEAEPYGEPRRVWVEDGHVLVEGYDGRIITMTPEVAIKMGRMIGEAGTESLINRVMEKPGDDAGDLPFRGQIEE